MEIVSRHKSISKLNDRKVKMGFLKEIVKNLTSRSPLLTGVENK